MNIQLIFIKQPKMKYIRSSFEILILTYLKSTEYLLILVSILTHLETNI